MAANVALLESSQERNHLNGFAQPHLVSDNPPSLLAVKFPEPLNTSLLVSERRREGGRGEGKEGEGKGRRGEKEGGWKRSEREGRRSRGGRDWEGGRKRRERREGRGKGGMDWESRDGEL